MTDTLKTTVREVNPKRWYRFSVAAFYFIQGIVFASWASRIPDIKAALGMNEAQLGGMLFFIPVGQMAAMAASGYLVSRYGSKKTLITGSVWYPAALILLGVADSIMSLSLCLIFYGMAANLCNIAVNTQAVGVERLYGRSIMASFHGLWSLAGFTGGLVGTLMVALDIVPVYHFCIIFAIVVMIIVATRNMLLPRDEDKNRESRQEPKRKIFTRPDRYILLLGIIAFGSMACEGTMFDWSSVYFNDVIRPPRNLVRLGYIAAMCSMALGRFTADRFITRFGVVNVLRVSGAVIATGLLTAVLFPHLWTATAGFLLVGFGVSSVIPICYSMAGRSTTMLPGVAIATVSTVGFLGFLLAPPLIGFVAHASSLRVSLAIIAGIGFMITVLAPMLTKKKR